MTIVASQAGLVKVHATATLTVGGLTLVRETNGQAENSGDAEKIYRATGAIGDFVWYDADGDGIQDVGEPGLANVKLDLYKDGAKVASTVTDADGGYLFSGLQPGNYTVNVTDAADPNGPLNGMIHTNGPQSQPDPTGTIVLSAGQVYKDADFGYVKTPDPGKAIIGDTVWYDDNGDGIQQPGEPGIPGIQVCATDAGGVQQACATTDANGHYRLEVPAGSYVVAPTNPPAGLTATTPTPHGPVILVAGDQYLDADFGYNDNDQQPVLGKVGDLVFLDGDKNGVFDGNNTALAGVSVDLIRDTDGDGVWDAGEPIIATVTTVGSLDAQGGNYLFTGVPAGRYLVHVSDTNAVLTDYARSPLGVAGVNNHNQADPYPVHLVNPGDSNRTADFGYYQVDRPNVGVIGNQVWVEPNDNGLFDVLQGDFGQPGVTVELLNAAGAVIATTTTGASGDYAFVHLAGGTYKVRVSDAYNVLAGYNPSIVPTPGADSTNKAQPYTVALPAGGYNLTADFGYTGGGGGQGTGTIGNLIWEDLNADGTYQAGEPGIGNVTVQLWYDADNSCTLNTGDFLVETQTSSGTVTLGGNYKFERNDLPAGNYLVRVTDSNTVLVGYTQSQGTNPGADNNSQLQPYCIVGFAGSDLNGSNLTADFGYWRPAALGDFVWQDINANGVQDESPLQGLNGVQITVKDSNGVQVAQVTTVNGLYNVTGLKPGVYTVTVTIPPAGYFRTYPAPPLPASHTVTLVSGETNNTLDFGYVYPTAVTVQRFDAVAESGVVMLSWQIEGFAPQGFHVWRADNVKGLQAEKLTPAPVTLAENGVYQYVDKRAVPGQSYWYWLEDVQDGQRYGPRSATVPTGPAMQVRAFMPVVTGK